jgi:uncharacterized protein
MALRFLTLALLAVGAGLLGLGVLQDSFIYHPSRDLEATPADRGMPYEDVRLTPPGGKQVAGWFVPATAPAGIILFLHGNAGNISHRIEDIGDFHRIGFSVLIVDYEGYGLSSGRPSEQALERDARAAWDHLVRDRSVAPRSIALYGESLGSYAALRLAQTLEAEGDPPRAVVLSGAFTSALEMGRRIFPLLPLSWLLRARLDNLSTIRQVTTPTLFVHGGRDDIVPLEMGRRLFEASAARVKEFHEVADAGHNTLMVAGRGVFTVIRRFVLEASEGGG